MFGHWFTKRPKGKPAYHNFYYTCHREFGHCKLPYQRQLDLERAVNKANLDLVGEPEIIRSAVAKAVPPLRGGHGRAYGIDRCKDANAAPGRDTPGPMVVHQNRDLHGIARAGHRNATNRCSYTRNGPQRTNELRCSRRDALLEIGGCECLARAHLADREWNEHEGHLGSGRIEQACPSLLMSKAPERCDALVTASRHNCNMSILLSDGLL